MWWGLLFVNIVAIIANFWVWARFGQTVHLIFMIACSVGAGCCIYKVLTNG